MGGEVLRLEERLVVFRGGQEDQVRISSVGDLASPHALCRSMGYGLLDVERVGLGQFTANIEENYLRRYSLLREPIRAGRPDNAGTANYADLHSPSLSSFSPYYSPRSPWTRAALWMRTSDFF